jgi:hypothetical protein
MVNGQNTDDGFCEALYSECLSEGSDPKDQHCMSMTHK